VGVFDRILMLQQVCHLMAWGRQVMLQRSNMNQIIPTDKVEVCIFFTADEPKFWKDNGVFELPTPGSFSHSNPQSP
jgi:hypothetical protein